MNKLNKSAIAIALSLGIAATASAHQDGRSHERKEGQRHSMHEGKGHGGEHGKQGRGHGGSQAGQQLMTPDERNAMQEKMRSAKTPEERQQIALANRAEMQKRATEKGITLPEHEHRGRHNHGANAPAATDTAK